MPRGSGVHLRGIGMSSISSAHEPRAAICQSSVCVRRKGGAYSGRLGSLPGTSSLASSWVLYIVVSHAVLNFVAARGGAKARYSGRRLLFGLAWDCLPMIAVCVATRSVFRALCVCVERAGCCSQWWCEGAVGDCGGSGGCVGCNKSRKFVLSHAPDMPPRSVYQSPPVAPSRQRSLTAVPRSNAHAMSKRYDPREVTHPLDVAQSAAFVGGASGTCGQSSTSRFREM
jgi:hypothetical protein